MYVGLTGGIGSGKSAAAECFAALGVGIVDADIVAREVVAPGQPALQQIAAHFGNQVIAADGSLQRRVLREIVFADPEQRRWLEQLTHPLIAQSIQRQLAASTGPYALLVSPLLLETTQRELVQRVLVIDAPETLQVARTVARDQAQPEQVRQIMAAQMPREQRLAHADDVIVNQGDLEQLRQQVVQLHQQYSCPA